MRIAELEMEPDPFGNNRRAKRRAILRAKGALAQRNAIPTVDPDTGKISQQGSVTIDRNINLDEPYNKPIPKDPWDKPKQQTTQPTQPQQQPTPKPRSGVVIRRPKNLGSDW